MKEEELGGGRKVWQRSPSRSTAVLPLPCSSSPAVLHLLEVAFAFNIPISCWENNYCVTDTM